MRLMLPRSAGTPIVSRRMPLWAAASLGMSVAILLAIATRNGLGLSPDSAGYLSAAQNLAKGKWFYTDIFLLSSLNDTSESTSLQAGSPLVSFPPLYPALLSTFSMLMRVDGMTAAWYLGLLGGATFLVISVLVVSYCSMYKPFTVWGWLFLLLAPPFWYNFTMLLSEAVFLPLTVMFMLSLHRYLTVPCDKRLLLVALSAGMALLTRYAGIVTVTVALTFILLRRVQPVQRRVRDAILFVLLATAPLVGWLLRNWYVSGTLMGERFPSRFSLTEVVYDTTRELWDWLLPPQIIQRVSPAVLVVITIVVILLHIALRNRQRGQISGSEPASQTMLMNDIAAAFFVQYVVFIVASALTTGIDRLNPRLLSPVLTPLLCICLWLLSTVWTRLHNLHIGQHARNVPNVVLLVAAMVTMVNAVGRSYHYVVARQRFVQEQRYLWEHIRRAYTQCVPRHSLLVSNDAPTVYCALGRPVIVAPRKYYHNSRKLVSPSEVEILRQLVSLHPRIVLIWVPDAPERRYLYTLNELSYFVKLKTIYQSEEVTIFAVLSHTN